MDIGIPSERRPYESRVGLSPAGVATLTQLGHRVFVEHEAGDSANFSDADYEQMGATIAYSAAEVFGRADLLLKVARPMEDELELIRAGTMLAGFLHLSSARESKLQILLDKQITAIAYEQIEAADGSLPVLRPFSQIGGAMSAQIGALLLQNTWGGKGILIGGVPGVPPAEVVILGAGVVGTQATQSFLGMGAHVTVIDHNLGALQRLFDRFPHATTLMSTRRSIARSVAYADIVVGAVLTPGQRAPIVVTREMVQSMRPRSVIIDLSIDEGGCVETSHPTTHEHPVFIEDNMLHYCVPNIPAAVSRTATHAFVNAAMPYIIEIAGNGLEAVLGNPSIEAAISTHKGATKHLTRLTGKKEQ